STPNLGRALRRVEANRGAPGVDGMTTDGLRPWLRDHWPEVRQGLEEGTYRPSPVRRVTIPKPGGGERLLGRADGVPIRSRFPSGSRSSIGPRCSASACW
ncbi:hypothetical protein ACWDKQ_34885, partial [Saccharopolyspora sp. NPDC000995]